MEKGISNFFDYYKESFNIEHSNPDMYSPLSLAYIGDSIFDLMIRTMVVSRSNKQVQKYHDEVTKIVCASAQATMMRGIKDRLTEAEHAIYKRGRNANFNTKAKNASMTDYRNATAFEAVVGYLYLNEDFVRLSDVVKMALEVLQMEDPSINYVPMIKPLDAMVNAASDDEDDSEKADDSKAEDMNSENEEAAEVFEHDKDGSEWENAEENDEAVTDDNDDDSQGYYADGSGD
ncbi:MAG: hypothetical protein IJ661_08325 [Lachnospiraceae bacterium]|nr:hypothetical protein [Lachnospiraceae bacterium]